MWTVAWTLFQWWAVIGWPDDVNAVSAGIACTGVLTLVAAGVLLDLRTSQRRPAAAIIRLRGARDAGVETPTARDLAA